MDFCNPLKSPYLVIKGLQALEPLDNVLVRVQVLLEYGSLILDMSLGCLVCHDFWSQPLVPEIKVSASSTTVSSRASKYRCPPQSLT